MRDAFTGAEIDAVRMESGQWLVPLDVVFQSLPIAALSSKWSSG
jgi:hypothetical protein